MKWRREIDYHGSRSYGQVRRKAPAFTAIVAWFASLGGRKRAKRNEPRAPGTLPPGAQRGYSLLGVSTAATPRERADCPFPIKSGPSFDRHDCRLLP